MPAYDFRCESCEEVFEVVRPTSERSEVECPQCGGATRRVFSPVGVVFKGSGFHATDYRASREGDSKKRDGSSDATKDGGSCDASGDSSVCDSCPAKKG